MKKLTLLLTATLAATLSTSAQSLLSWNFAAESNGTVYTTSTPTGDYASAVNFTSDINNASVVNGTGMATAGNSSGMSNTSTFNTAGAGTLSSGIHTLDFVDVFFNNIGGGSDDVIMGGFRTFSSGSQVGSSSSDMASFRIGNINASGGLDAELWGFNGSGGQLLQTVNDFATNSGAFTFRILLDQDADTFDLLYSTDGGLNFNAIGSQQTGITPATNFIAQGFSVVDFGGGDNISIGGVQLTTIPEPTSATLLAGLGLAFFLRRKR